VKRAAIIRLCLACVAGAFPPTLRAGTIQTLDGQILNGAVSVDADGQLLIDVPDGPKDHLDLKNLFDVIFTDNPGAGQLSCGVALTDGSVIAADVIDHLNGDSLSLVSGGYRASIPLSKIARIVFRPIPPAILAKAPPGRQGALLDGGDFFEGDLKALNSRYVRLESILFGSSSFDTRTQALAILLAEVHPADSNWRIVLVDGTTILSNLISFSGGKLSVLDSLGHRLTADASQIARISCGSKRVTSLLNTAPFQQVPPDGGGMTIDSNPVPGQLRGPPAARMLILAAGASAAWRLDGTSLAFVCRVGVPAAFTPYAQVRFIVLTDGTAVYKSPQKISIDEPSTISVSLAGVHQLTLRVESSLTSDLGGIGIWADPQLVKASE
jgi:NPCBM/NEW2 domain